MAPHHHKSGFDFDTMSLDPSNARTVIVKFLYLAFPNPAATRARSRGPGTGSGMALRGHVKEWRTRSLPLEAFILGVNVELCKQARMLLQQNLVRLDYAILSWDVGS